MLSKDVSVLGLFSSKEDMSIVMEPLHAELGKYFDFAWSDSAHVRDIGTWDVNRVLVVRDFDERGDPLPNNDVDDVQYKAFPHEISSPVREDKSLIAKLIRFVLAEGIPPVVHFPSDMKRSKSNARRIEALLRAPFPKLFVTDAREGYSMKTVASKTDGGRVVTHRHELIEETGKEFLTIVRKERQFYNLYDEGLFKELVSAVVSVRGYGNRDTRSYSDKKKRCRQTAEVGEMPVTTCWEADEVDESDETLLENGTPLYTTYGLNESTFLADLMNSNLKTRLGSQSQKPVAMEQSYNESENEMLKMARSLPIHAIILDGGAEETTQMCLTFYKQLLNTYDNDLRRKVVGMGATIVFVDSGGSVRYQNISGRRDQAKVTRVTAGQFMGNFMLTKGAELARLDVYPRLSLRRWKLKHRRKGRKVEL
jgi:hypothetical protein